MDLARLAAALFYVKDNIYGICWEVIRDNKDLQQLAIELNQKQLLEGRNSVDEKFGDYSDRHAMRRSALGLQTSHIDLRFTGEFFDGFIVEPGEKSEEIFRITSTNDKTKILVERLSSRKGFGEDIFGLNEDSIEIFKKSLLPKLRIRVLKFLNA